jgi:isoleucyl-tRNA synthetase
MPFAQHGWIAEKGKVPPKEHPADYISEGLDQTRGWFYTLHVISTFLTGKPASKRVLVGNLVLDAKKQKMSKSRGNTVDPWEEIGSHGVDAIRWHFLAQSHPWVAKSYDSDAVGDSGREFFGTLWNCFSFFATYAEVDRFDPNAAGQRAPSPASRSELDRWLLAETERLVEDVGSAFERYDLLRATTALATFVDRKLSNWWIRLSRERFWGKELDGDKLTAHHTLLETLERVALLLAPLAPFFADALWQWLRPGARSVHLESFPTPRRELRQPDLERDMATVLDVVGLARRARNAAGVNLRQPLKRVLVKGADARADEVLRGHFAPLVRDELNVHEVEVVAGARLAELRTLEAKPNYRVLGPKLGPRLNAAKQALAATTQEQVETLLRDRRLVLSIAGAPVEFTTAEIEVVVKGKAGFGVETDGRTLVALDTTLTPELVEEGLVREVVKRVNNSRREAQLRVEDRIELVLAGSTKVLAAAQKGRDRIASDTLATRIDLRTDGATVTAVSGDWRAFDWDVDGEKLRVELRRAAR